ncbi:progestin and adipoq receptor family member 3 [Anaeramoeba flamelloides]|uniref:Progestin and adipoq receptor family member 3 n=1 Tax=Anaeramoeba flamelloides TaxID=1746091 RepID=A0ABQ8YBI4_9EUKA|nr:progestin and adipoq receptor family member 3 [Anaeramoeba flamelloides]
MNKPKFSINSDSDSEWEPLVTTPWNGDILVEEKVKSDTQNTDQAQQSGSNRKKGKNKNNKKKKTQKIAQPKQIKKQKQTQFSQSVPSRLEKKNSNQNNKKKAQSQKNLQQDNFQQKKPKDFDPSQLSENETAPEDLSPEPEVKATKFSLHTIYTTPLSLGTYRYLIKGYRAYFTKKLCITTAILRWHNETINVFSHLLASLVALVMFFLIPFLPTYKEARLFAKICLSAFPVGAFHSYFASTLFHTLKCHSFQTRSKLLKLDLTGIIVNAMGSLMTFYYYGLKDDNFFRFFHLLFYFCCAVLLMYLYYGSKKLLKFVRIRVWILIFYCAYGIVPLIHSCFLLPRDEWFDFIWKPMGMYSFFGVGTIFYLSKIPERFAMGRFDIVGASHQFWHLFCLLAEIWTFYTHQMLAKQYPNV